MSSLTFQHLCDFMQTLIENARGRYMYIFVTLYLYRNVNNLDF